MTMGRTEVEMTRHNNSLQLAEIVNKVRVLRAYTQRSGFRTTRSEKEILARLGPDDLAAVLLALENGNRPEDGHSNN